MNPWLIGLLLAGTGVALAGGSAPAAAAAPPSSAEPPGASGGGGVSANPAPALILRAVAVALRTETDPGNLTAFGDALEELGFTSSAGELLAKAARLGSGAPPAPGAPGGAQNVSSSAPLGTVLTGPQDASGAATPVAVQYLPPGGVALSSGYVLDKTGAIAGKIDAGGNFVPKGGGAAVSKGGTPISGSSEFGPTGLDPTNPGDLPYWVNLYAKTHYTLGQMPTTADVDRAVKNAIASYASKTGAPNISTFWSVLNAYGFTSEAEELHALTVVPFYVQAYAGSSRWDASTIEKAIDEAMKGKQIVKGAGKTIDDTSPNQLDFANALWGYQAFGIDWSPWAINLANAVAGEFIRADEQGVATTILGNKPGQW
jgi:hypothetical protein